ncbi:extracellular solute-binding protein [Paenibacillus lupini]|uniref:extracellular solute-binding protein n=1 Tax=Paenibacillus lupini TaxID=1450204 RepID=UPI001420D861|nr:extracellular solute-binding protein [Paenibacillus lupini]NIK22088.1 ABC-type glycerol-3-phosphate transport system substrate-binding protein [Paenibacillus lupini]
MSNKRRKRYGIAVLVLLVFFLSIWTFYPSGQLHNGRAQAMGGFQAITDTDDKGGYNEYLKSYSADDRPSQVIRIEGESFAESDGEGFEVDDHPEGLNGKAVITPDAGSISWNVPIEQAGLYNLRIHYYPIEGKSSAIERKLTINDEQPFTGAEDLLFDRLWGNRDAKIERDDRGNDLRPRQIEKPAWQLKPLMDSEGYYAEPYLFHFDKGTQKLTLTASREPMAIDYIELYQDQAIKSYEDLKKDYEAEGLKPAKDQSMMIQAEDAMLKSSPTLYPLSDKSSPAVIPYDVSKIRINAIGGVNWKLPGQWMEWEVDVQQDGLYQIALKRKQDQLRGVFSTRSLMIDGEYPFKEMKQIPFNFDMDWKMDVMGGDEPYLFHLTKGKHMLRLSVSLGEIAPLLQTIESSVLQLNEIYRKILIITSNSPDPYRDYQLEKRIPEMTEVFKTQAATIKSVADYLEQTTGEQSDKVAVLHTMVTQLEEMAAKPETVAKRLTAFKINVGGLGTWILNVRVQPLTLDYLVVSSPEAELPRASATFFQKVKHELGGLIASYTEDYDSIGNTKKSDKSITVWITTGRDQAQVLKSLIDESFTPESKISVKLRLVPANILLPATLADEGPDVAMQIGEDVPVNYAMRKASADLSEFPDFKEVASRFNDSALVPYKYSNGVYALPEQQTFPMLFYRKDVLAELGLTPPQTWQEVYNMISVLQKHNMEFWLPIDDVKNNANLIPNTTFSMMLYQNNGKFYTDDDKKSALDSDISMEVFKKWTQFYTNYKFPLIADFPNRFRTGEMPIGIADYTTYNNLTVMAPEIKGLWDFTMVPGTEMPDGTVNHEVASHTTAVMMLENAKDKDASWEFMKWWTSKETQIAYGREMEGLLGEAARYPTANIEALEELPWPVKDYQNLQSQWQWVEGIPQVPGGYFTGRHLDNAFRKVVNGSENPREALSDYLLYINDEIAIKRKEFKLPN